MAGDLAIVDGVARDAQLAIERSLNVGIGSTEIGRSTGNLVLGAMAHTGGRWQGASLVQWRDRRQVARSLPGALLLALGSHGKTV